MLDGARPTRCFWGEQNAWCAQSSSQADHTNEPARPCLPHFPPPMPASQSPRLTPLLLRLRPHPPAEADLDAPKTFQDKVDEREKLRLIRRFFYGVCAYRECAAARGRARCGWLRLARQQLCLRASTPAPAVRARASAPQGSPWPLLSGTLQTGLPAGCAMQGVQGTLRHPALPLPANPQPPPPPPPIAPLPAPRSHRHHRRRLPAPVCALCGGPHHPGAAEPGALAVPGGAAVDLPHAPGLALPADG